MRALGRPLRCAIGYTILAVICFDPTLSRTLDLHRSLLPLLFFVVFEGARPVAELVQQSCLAMGGALIGLALSSWCIMIGSRALNLICFVAYNFVFALYRLQPSLFVGYLCASISTQVVLVVPLAPAFAHGLRFLTQLGTSCLLIVASVMITWPPTSSGLLRTCLAQGFASMAQVMATIASDGSTFRSSLRRLSDQSSSLPALLRAAAIEVQYGRLPLATARLLSETLYEVTSQLQGLSFGRHTSSWFGNDQAPIRDTIEALQAMSADLSARLLNPDHVPDDDPVQRLRSCLARLQSSISAGSVEPTLPALVVSFRLRAMASAFLDADAGVRDLPPAPILQLPIRSGRPAPVSYAMLGAGHGRASIVFAAKMALALGLLAAPSFIDAWRWFFERWITTWAMITASVLLTPTLGAVQTAITFRLIGTVSGATSALLVAVLCRRQPMALASVTFVLVLVSYRIRFGTGRKLFRSLVVAWQLMFTNVLVNTIGRADDDARLPAYIVPIEVAAQTGLAMLLCWTLMIAVVPTLARDLLRQQLSQQLLWTGILFDHLSKRLVVGDNDDADADQAAFERHLRWQQTVTLVELLDQAKAEPNPLDGPFPSRHWDRLLETTSHLLESIELAHAAVRYGADDDDLDGVQLSAPLLNEFFVLAAALHAGVSLPPMALVRVDRGRDVGGDDADPNASDGVRDPVWMAAFDLATQDTVRLLAEVERSLRAILGELSFKLPRYETSARRPLRRLRVMLPASI